ncbi:MAG: VOC family protein [Paracoccaceae bacterium]
MILGVHHAAISTPDIDRLIGFYTGLLGFEVVHRQSWAADAETQNALLGARGSAAQLAMLRHRNCYLELFQFETPVPEPRSPHQRLFGHGLTHLCIAVQDMAAEHARLAAVGVIFHSSPLPRPTFNAVYGHDPDGNVVELLELYEPTHAFAPHWQ